MRLMLAYIVSGSNPNKERSALNQIGRLHPGDIIVINRNLRSKGGYSMFSSALSEASEPEQYEVINGIPQYWRHVKVGPWHILPELVTHAQVAAHLGTEVYAIHTVSKINDPLAERLFAYVFQRMYGI